MRFRHRGFLRLKDRRRLKLLYRTLQLHHKLAEEFASPGIPYFLGTTLMLMITSFYSVIRWKIFGFVLSASVLCIGISITIGSYYITGLVVRYTSCSERHSKLGTTSYPMVRLSTQDKKFFLSCRSLHWRVGNLCIIVFTKQTFTKIMQDIVIATVVHMLILIK